MIDDFNLECIGLYSGGTKQENFHAYFLSKENAINPTFQNLFVVIGLVKDEWIIQRNDSQREFALRVKEPTFDNLLMALSKSKYEPATVYIRKQRINTII